MSFSDVNLRAFFDSLMMCELHGGMSRLYTWCLSTSQSTLFSWSWTLWATWKRVYCKGG